MSDLDLLARQRIVNETNNNFLVEASAGSGKTTSLVDRMVAMVESGIDISNIVAITFTKRAANEFYERFYKRLYERSKEEYAPKKYELLPLPTKQTRDYDKKALENIDLCFLGTIDSFCNRVLKEHPFEANIPSTSNIVTNREDLIPFIDNVLDGLRKDKNELMDLIDSIHSKENIYQLIFYGLEKREYKFNYDKSDSVHFNEKQNEFKKLLSDIKEILKFINDLDFKYLSNKKSKEIYKNIKNEYARLIAINFDDYKEINKLRYLKLKEFSYKDKIGEVHIPNIISEYFILPIGEKAYTVKINAEELNKFFDAFSYFVYVKSLEFIELIRPAIYSCFKDNGQLQFIDNLIYLNDLLSNEKTGQKILNSVRKKYKYYLIDEFQDTSPLQIELFFRLSSNNYSKDWKSIVPNKGALFMVGDPKQSIYRFKAADFETYSNVKERLLKNKEIGEVIYLTRNFRSCKSLIEYFNKKFPKYLLDIPNMQSHCDLIPIDNCKPDNKLSGLYLYSLEKDQDEPIYIANLIKKIKDDSKGLIKYSDFMIIPKSKTKVSLYKEALAKLSIPSFAEGPLKYQGKLFTSVITTFKYLLLHDELSAYELLTSNLFNIDIPSLDLSNTLDEKIKETIPSIGNLSNDVPSLLLEHLINNEYILSHSGVEGLDLLIFILNILKYEENNGNIKCNKDVVLLINKIINEGEKERVALLTTDLDVVRIANAHKVKGLQAKIVILASNAISERGPREPSSYVDHHNNLETIFKIEKTNAFNIDIIKNKDSVLDSLKELESKYILEENKRLMYVAATRAENALIICSSEKSNWKELLEGTTANKIDFSEIEILPEYHESIDKINPKDLLNVSLINEENKSLSNPTFKLVSPSDTKSISIKEIDEEVKLIQPKNDSAIKGTIVHKLMECIVKSKGNKIDISKCKEIVEEYQAKEYLSMLEEVYKTIYSGGYKQVNGFKDDILKEIQNSECYYEVPFSYKKDNNIVFGYIDLLLVKDNKYTIIDYKTDKNINTDHSHQLDEYKKALKSTLGVDSNAYIYNIKIN